jgi:hypothetical protein
LDKVYTKVKHDAQQAPQIYEGVKYVDMEKWVQASVDDACTAVDSFGLERKQKEYERT